MKRLRLRSNAEEEIADAALWYESESKGLGSRFLDEVESTLVRISDFPLMYQIVRPPHIRRSYLKHFPYIIFYTVRNEEIVVVGCSHMHRNPASWPNA